MGGPSGHLATVGMLHPSTVGRVYDRQLVGSQPVYREGISMCCEGLLTFLHGFLRRGEADLRVRAVAERLCRRAATATERDGAALLRRVIVAVGVDDLDGTGHQVGTIGPGRNRYFICHNVSFVNVRSLTLLDHVEGCGCNRLHDEGVALP